MRVLRIASVTALVRSMPAAIALLAVSMALSGTAVAAGTTALSARQEAAGANCVKPLDLQSAFQDLSNCNLKGVTIDGNVPGGSPCMARI
jgi:hypothetical protein